MEKLVGMIIDTTYNRMKKKCPHDIHEKWDWKPMDMTSLSYAAIDAYVSYELYNMLITMRDGDDVLTRQCPCLRAFDS
jgi:hypothetical protein